MLPLSRDRRKKPAAIAPKAPRRVVKARAKRPKTDGATQFEVDLEPDSPVIREHQKAEARRRGFRIAAWWVIVIVVGTVGWAVIKETFVENPKFGLREVIVNTRGALTPRKIVRVLGLTEGCSVLTLNMHSLAEKLRRLPEVKDARIAKDNDGRLIIDVNQRDPIAWVESSALNLTPMKSGFGCLVDAEGIAIPCEVILDEYAVLPVIQHHTLNQINPGGEIQDVSMREAISLLKALEARCEEGADTVRRIEVPNPWSLVAKFDDGASVTFGPGKLKSQLARFDRVKLQARQYHWQIDTLDLLPVDNAAITFRRPPDLAALRAVPTATLVATPPSSHR